MRRYGLIIMLFGFLLSLVSIDGSPQSWIGGMMLVVGTILVVASLYKGRIL